MKVVISRKYDVKQTTGVLTVFNDDLIAYSCVTMELPWQLNEKNVSCIPEGKYKVKRHVSPSKGECFKIQKVTGRTDILIHVGNFNKDTQGCILPGRYFLDLNKDGLKDVAYSKVAMQKLLFILYEDFDLYII